MKEALNRKFGGAPSNPTPEVKEVKKEMNTYENNKTGNNNLIVTPNVPSSNVRKI
jgi:hypothetical protein